MKQPAFRRVALVGKQTPEIAQSLRALRDFLRQRGCEVMLERDTAAGVGENGTVVDYEEIGRSADLAIVVGGDGTMLAAARKYGRVVQVGHLERFNPAVRATVPLITKPMFFEALCQLGVSHLLLA